MEYSFSRRVPSLYNNFMAVLLRNMQYLEAPQKFAKELLSPIACLKIYD